MDYERTGKDFPSNGATVLSKLRRGALLRLEAGDCLRCAAGQVWVTARGGDECLLREGQWLRVPAGAREVFLTALSEALVARAPARPPRPCLAEAAKPMMAT